MSDRLYVVVPSIFVQGPPKSPELLPIPGQITLEHLTPKKVEHPPFLIPWKPLRTKPQHPVGHPEESSSSFPVDLDAPGLQSFLSMYDIEGAMRVVFKHAPQEVPRIMASLSNPFRQGSNDEVDDGPICWTLIQKVGRWERDSKLGGKKMKDRHKHFTRGPPWSILSVGTEKCVKKNYIYDGEGNLCVEVDFGCGANPCIHYHPMIEGNLEHSSSRDEHHCLPWYAAPWFWLIFPDLRRTGSKKEHGFDDWGVPNHVTEVQDGTFKWLSVSLAYDDLWGEKQFSDDW
eukprot:PhF_6_TR13575/c0_g1_i1/m.21710